MLSRVAVPLGGAAAAAAASAATIVPRALPRGWTHYIGAPRLRERRPLRQRRKIVLHQQLAFAGEIHHNRAASHAQRPILRRRDEADRALAPHERIAAISRGASSSRADAILGAARRRRRAGLAAHAHAARVSLRRPAAEDAMRGTPSNVESIRARRPPSGDLRKAEQLADGSAARLEAGLAHTRAMCSPTDGRRCRRPRPRSSSVECSTARRSARSSSSSSGRGRTRRCCTERAGRGRWEREAAAGSRTRSCSSRDKDAPRPDARSTY